MTTHFAGKPGLPVTVTKMLDVYSTVYYFVENCVYKCFPHTSFVLYPLPVCFKTEQSTFKASLFAN